MTDDYNAHVVRYNSTTLFMYAHGLIDQYSHDGIHWVNFTQHYGLSPNPWLNQTNPYPNEHGIIGNSEPVKLPNGTYLMYYDARNCNSQGKNYTAQPCQPSDYYWAANQAKSPDGIHNWTRSPNNPLVGGLFDSVANPNVVIGNGVYYAVLDYYGPSIAGYTSDNITEALATSVDGVHFSYVYGPREPLLSIDVERKLDAYCNQVGDGWIVERSSGIYLFYDEDANVAADVPHASIWLAYLPGTTLAQLANGRRSLPPVIVASSQFQIQSLAGYNCEDITGHAIVYQANGIGGAGTLYTGEILHTSFTSVGGPVDFWILSQPQYFSWLTTTSCSALLGSPSVFAQASVATFNGTIPIQATGYYYFVFASPNNESVQMTFEADVPAQSSATLALHSASYSASSVTIHSQGTSSSQYLAGTRAYSEIIILTVGVVLIIVSVLKSRLRDKTSQRHV